MNNVKFKSKWGAFALAAGGLVVFVGWSIFTWVRQFDVIKNHDLRHCAICVVLGDSYSMMFPSFNWWETEMSRNELIIKNASADDRVTFFRIIILKTLLSEPIPMYKSEYFLDIVADDSQLVCRDLIDFKTSKLYYKYSIAERRELDIWIQEFQGMSREMKAMKR